MCHNLYIATHRPLPTENDAPLKFHLEDVREYVFADVRQKFSLPYIYYAGSTTGCSCDLHSSSYSTMDDDIKTYYAPEGDTAICMAAFYDFLKQESQTDAIELYSCWDGDEHLPIETSIVFNPQTLSLTPFVRLPTEERRFMVLQTQIG